MQPLDYALAMAREIERLGGKVFENSPALSTGRFGASHLVATPRGKVSAHHLVICTGGYTRRLIPALRRAMLPIATYAMASEPNDALLDRAIATPMCISDDRRAGDYYRRTTDGRLIWGGRITARTRDPADLAALLRKDMIEVYPQLADAQDRQRLVRPDGLCAALHAAGREAGRGPVVLHRLRRPRPQHHGGGRRPDRRGDRRGRRPLPPVRTLRPRLERRPARPGGGAAHLLEAAAAGLVGRARRRSEERRHRAAPDVQPSSTT